MFSNDDPPIWLMPGLPWPAIRAAFAKAPGREGESGKLASPESSAALVANVFGSVLTDPVSFRASGLVPECTEPTLRLDIEQEMRFPWRGGRHPWLDVAIETRTWLIGVESKRYEPFRTRGPVVFSEAFNRPVWGEGMAPFLALRDGLLSASLQFRHLDAVQLVKHALGLRTQGQKRGLRPALTYLFAEPKRWPKGAAVAAADHARHREEVQRFGELARGADVVFHAISYQEFLDGLAASGSASMANQVLAIRSLYDL